MERSEGRTRVSCGSKNSRETSRRDRELEAKRGLECSYFRGWESRATSTGVECRERALAGESGAGPRPCESAASEGRGQGEQVQPESGVQGSTAHRALDGACHLTRGDLRSSPGGERNRVLYVCGFQAYPPHYQTL